MVHSERLADNTPLPESIEKHIPETFTGGIEAVVRPAFRHQAEPFVATPHEEKDSYDKNNNKCYYIRCQFINIP
jgi:hypothetical protein